jgi:epidermin biosynthesis protein epiB
MKYYLSNYFCVRTPSFSLDFYEKFKNLNNTLLKDHSIAEAIEKIIFFSSIDLYRDFYCTQNSGFLEYSENKSDKPKLEAIKRYMIRSSTRATPFGLCSGVSMGNFSEKSKEIIKNDECLLFDTKVFLSVDSSWVIELIDKLLDNEQIVRQLSYKFNNNYFIKSERIYTYNMYNIFSEDSNNSVVDISYTDLIKLLKNKIKNPLKFEKILDIIREEYPEISTDTIESTVFLLIKNNVLNNEFILLNHESDLFKHVLFVISNKIETKNEPFKEVYFKLSEIEKNIKLYNISKKIDYLYKAVEVMRDICPKAEKCFSICKGDFYDECSLDYSIKNKIVDFINSICKINLHLNLNQLNYQHLCEFVENNYGKNTYIKATDLFNDVNKSSLYKRDNSNDEIEISSKIKSVINYKIQEAIINSHKEVFLTENDFKEFLYTDNDKKTRYNNYIDSFDINFIITKNTKNDSILYWLSPSPGSNRGGNMVHRFSEVLDKEVYKNYLFEIEKHDKTMEKNGDFIYVDTKDVFSFNRARNISNKERINKHCLNIYSSFKDSENIYLDDIYFCLKEDLFLMDMTSKKEINIVTNDMLISEYNNEFIRFIRNFSDSKKYNPLSFINLINDSEYIYSPRIIYEGFIVSPRRWRIYDINFNTLNFIDFYQDFMRFKCDFCLDNYVYLKNHDNRLIISTLDKDDIKYIYTNLKKNSYTEFEEMEVNTDSKCVIHNKKNEPVLGEFVFTLYKDLHTDKKTNNFKKNDIVLNKIIDFEQEVHPFFDNWIYYKVYVEYNKQNVVINEVYNNEEICDNTDKIFFLRYSDNLGEHLRFRFKLKEINNKSITALRTCFKNLRDNGRISNIIVDTYRRELYRYGGIELIEYIETLFSYDSVIVSSILENNDLSNLRVKEESFFLGVISILKNFFEDEYKLYVFIKKFWEVDKKTRKEYLKNKKYYTKLFENIWNKEYIFENIKFNKFDILGQRSNVCSSISYALNSQYYDFEQLSNIIMSLVHMFCNRLYGDNNYENKIISIIFLTARDIYNRNKYLKE